MRIIAALPGAHSRATWRPDFGVVVTVVYLTYRPQHLSECPSGTCRQRDSPPTCQTYILDLTQNITQDGSDRYTDRLTDSTMYPVDIKLTNLPAALRYLPGDKLFPKITGWSWLPGRMRCKETTVRWQGRHSRHRESSPPSSSPTSKMFVSSTVGFISWGFGSRLRQTYFLSECDTVYRVNSQWKTKT